MTFEKDKTKHRLNRKLVGLFMVALFLVATYFGTTFLYAEYADFVLANANTGTVKSAAIIDLCTVVPGHILNNPGVNPYTTDDVVISGCTFTIDGAYTFASMTIGNSVGSNDSVLNHSATTTTIVYRMDITTTGAFIVNSDGGVDANYKGFVDGYTTDGAGGTTNVGGTLDRSGGSHGGRGGTDGSSDDSIEPYDSLTQPVDPGAGGGLYSTSGVGGGYIKITSADFANYGTISALANAGVQAGGAGGGIWITTTGQVTGAGTIRANGAQAVRTDDGSGGGGRIAFYYDSSQPGNGTLGFNFQAYGGDSSIGNSSYRGGAGTIYIDKTDVPGQGDIIVDNNGKAITYVRVAPLPSGTFASLTVSNNGNVSNTGIMNINTVLIDNTSWALLETVTSQNFTVTNSSIIYQEYTTTTTVHRLDLTATSSFTVDATSQIIANSRGYIKGYTTDGAGGTTNIGGTTDRSGGSHGGRGGGDSVGDESITPFDNLTEPVDLGAGGGTYKGGNGGGYIKISTANFTNNGIIGALGQATTGSGGGGGGIWIIATGQVTGTGTGTIRANGAQAVRTDDGSGGGGRIAFYYDSSQPGNGALGFNFQAYGGDSAISNSDYRGGAGTIYIYKTDVHTVGQGEIIIDNNSKVVSAARIATVPDGTFTSLTINNGGNGYNAGTLSIPTIIVDNASYIFTQGLTSSTISLNSSSGIFGTVNTGTFSLTNSSEITSLATTTTAVYRLDITATSSLSIDATSSVNVNYKGFIDGYISDGAGGTTNVGGTTDRSGGSHGGRGGTDSVGDDSILPYDNFAAPVDPGAGGGSYGTSGTGGGYVKITSVDFTNAGTITANGNAGVQSGAAGGGIWIATTGQVVGTGIIRANGAQAVRTDNGSGGGGRIALHYDSSVSGNSIIGFDFQAYGGDSVVSNTGYRGGQELPMYTIPLQQLVILL